MGKVFRPMPLPLCTPLTYSNMFNLDLTVQEPPSQPDIVNLAHYGAYKYVEFLTNYAKMPIVAFLPLLSENKKNSSDKMLPQWEQNPGPKIPSPAC